MGTVIYSASPLQAFMGAIVTGLILFLLALLLILPTFFNRREKMSKRLLMIGLGGFLLLVGGLIAFVSAREYMTGSKTVIAKLEDKFIARDNCDNGNTCERYMLELVAESKYYDFNVPPAAYEKTQVRVCYEVTYYPAKSLLGQWLGEQSYAEAFEAIAAVTNITVADAAACP
jgi:hypothetical protein